MSQLGKYKKYIIGAAVIQAIIVVLIGYNLFKAKGVNEGDELQTQKRSAVEQPQATN